MGSLLPAVSTPSPHRDAPSSVPVLPTGIEELDRLLPRAGLLLGRLTEISGERASGKRTIATEICSGLLQRQQHVVWIDGCGGFYPLPALESCAALQQLLVVRLPQPSTIQAALRAADILLQATSALALLVLDLGACREMYRSRPTLANRALVRLQRGAERSGTAVVLITEKSASQPSLGALITLHLTVQRRGQHELRVAIAKSKLGQLHQHTEVAVDGPHGVSLAATV